MEYDRLVKHKNGSVQKSLLCAGLELRIQAGNADVHFLKESGVD